MTAVTTVADISVKQARRSIATKGIRAPSRRRASDNQTKDVAGVGAKLKSARERSGVSVRGLARNLNLSPSLISQIERGHVMPSVGTLYAMVSELGVSLDELFEGKSKKAGNGNEAPIQQTQSGPVRRGKNREAIRLADGVRWELLTPTPDADLEFLYVVYEAGAESCDKDMLVRHGGMEYAYIISGQLGVRIGFNEYALHAGDSISFDAQSPHRLWTIGRTPAVAIWAVLNRSGDRRTGRRQLARARHKSVAQPAGPRVRKKQRRR
jgi:transcriptional regulator with XRE-family HTH domain